MAVFKAADWSARRFFDHAQHIANLPGVLGQLANLLAHRFGRAGAVADMGAEIAQPGFDVFQLLNLRLRIATEGRQVLPSSVARVL